MQSGAKYFLVPTAQGDQDIANARAVVGNKVQIIPVATLDEALAVEDHDVVMVPKGYHPVVVPFGRKAA